MFKLSKVKEIRRKYKFNQNGEIELTGREAAKNPRELTNDEKIYIEAALFLYGIFRKKSYYDSDPILTIYRGLSDEEFLEQIQREFIKEALTTHEFETITFSGSKMSHVIGKDILYEENGALSFLHFALLKCGKRIHFLAKYDLEGFSKTMAYELIDSTASFNSNLNLIPSSKPKPIILTEEQKVRRKQFVDELMKTYEQNETPIEYAQRLKDEYKNELLVYNLVGDRRCDGTFEIIHYTALKKIIHLLFAAQSLTLAGKIHLPYTNGDTVCRINCFEALIDKPEISTFLSKMKKMDVLAQMLGQEELQVRGMEKNTSEKSATPIIDEQNVDQIMKNVAFTLGENVTQILNEQPDWNNNRIGR